MLRVKIVVGVAGIAGINEGFGISAYQYMAVVLNGLTGNGTIKNRSQQVCNNGEPKMVDWDDQYQRRDDYYDIFDDYGEHEDDYDNDNDHYEDYYEDYYEYDDEYDEHKEDG